MSIIKNLGWNYYILNNKVAIILDFTNSTIDKHAEDFFILEKYEVSYDYTSVTRNIINTNTMMKYMQNDIYMATIDYMSDLSLDQLPEKLDITSIILDRYSSYIVDDNINTNKIYIYRIYYYYDEEMGSSNYIRVVVPDTDIHNFTEEIRNRNRIKKRRIYGEEDIDLGIEIQNRAIIYGDPSIEDYCRKGE